MDGGNDDGKTGSSEAVPPLLAGFLPSIIAFVFFMVP